MARNNRSETPLHFAAKHGCLNKVPSEFLTKATLTALDYYGRTPLHVAADYGHADQIPLEFLTPDVLSIPTKNFTSNTILHIIAGRNEITKLPGKTITPEMWNVKNGYGSTPREILNDIIPTQRQLATLRDLEITFSEARVTRQMAAELINAEHEKRRRASRTTLALHGGHPPDPPVVVGPPARITLFAKSSSRKSPYKVEFIADGPSVRVYCHCPAGVQQWMCKHKLALILGEPNMLFDAGQTGLLAQIQSWPQYTDLRRRTEDFQNKLSELEEARTAEDSKFYAWLGDRDTAQHANTDEGTPLIQIYIGIEDDDPEVQKKWVEVSEIKGELKRMEKTVKEDFMLGLTMGFHRLNKTP